MRVKKMSALALIVAAAGLSLTACNSGDGSSASANTSASTTASSSTGASSSTTGSTSTGGQGSTSGSSSSGSTGSTGSTGSSKGSGSAAQAKSSTSGARCKVPHLAFSATASGTEDEIVINMKNTGSSTCSMHGFPGVQLVGPDGLGDTGPDAARADATASTVTVGPGEETRFLLHFSPDTSGSGKTYTRLSVTPPNETVSEIVNLNDLTITVAAATGTVPDVIVDPVGYHVGSGK
ncbi:Protein of unknown function [Streptomyces sp. OV198]|uniref:DUF4232 domain-containing protein n=1 Tax=Streptomyces sp. OV198 TaxID=1882787 RepID=UPI000BDD9D22|nr:DUF4232 domain-containing protein [Streptomyces sp. OV198]SOE58596.1 Protein of unknown function [Streptomyces sp. OV198]